MIENKLPKSEPSETPVDAQRTEKIGYWLGMALGLLFFLLGGYLIYSDFAAQTWPDAQGNIIRASLKQEFESNGWSYFPDIDYTYSWIGQDFRGHCCIQGSADAAYEQRILDRHRVGSKTDIRVNPAHPDESRLADDIRPLDWTKVLLAVFGLSVFLVFLGIKTGRLKTATPEETDKSPIVRALQKLTKKP